MMTNPRADLRCFLGPATPCRAVPPGGGGKLGESIGAFAGIKVVVVVVVVVGIRIDFTRITIKIAISANNVGGIVAAIAGCLDTINIVASDIFVFMVVTFVFRIVIEFKLVSAAAFVDAGGIAPLFVLILTMFLILIRVLKHHRSSKAVVRFVRIT